MDTSPHADAASMYDLWGVKEVMNFVHWLDGQLMAWSSVFLIIAALMVVLDNTTDIVAKTLGLKVFTGVAIGLGVESQGRILLKYARMSWDRNNKWQAFWWAMGALPIFVVLAQLGWVYFVKSSEGLTEEQALARIGLTLTFIEGERTIALCYLGAMNALSYITKPKVSLEDKLAEKREEAALIRADADVIAAKAFKRDANLASVARGGAQMRNHVAAVWKGQVTEVPGTINPASVVDVQPYTPSAVENAYGMTVAPVSYTSDTDNGDDDPDPTSPPSGPSRGRVSGSLGARGRPSIPVTDVARLSVGEPSRGNRAMSGLMANDVKEFLLGESRRWDNGQTNRVPTQQDVLGYLNSCGFGQRGVTRAVQQAIVSAYQALSNEGVTLAWDREPARQALTA